MPKPGQKIETSNGQSISFLRTAAETDGELLEIRVKYRPHSEMPPAHFHPFQREHLIVLSGSFHVLIEGDEATYEAGQEFDVPAGTIRWMHNAASRPGELN